MTFPVFLVMFMLKPLVAIAQTNYWEDPDSIRWYFSLYQFKERIGKIFNEIASYDFYEFYNQNNEHVNQLKKKKILHIPKYYYTHFWDESHWVESDSIKIDGIYGFGSINQARITEDIEWEEIIMPEAIEFISYGAFARLPCLKKVNWPDSLKYLGSLAFAKCDSLSSINLEDGVKFTHILDDWGYGPFQGTNIKRVELPPDLRYIPDGLFVDMRELTTVVWPETIDSIQARAFYGCKKLQIPWDTDFRNVKKIGWRSFANRSFEELDLPLSVDTIVSEAFSWYGGEANHIGKFIYRKPFVQPAYKYDYVHYTQSIFNGNIIYDFVIAEDFPQSTIGRSDYYNCFSPCRIRKLVIPPCIKVLENSSFGAVDSLVLTSSNLIIKRDAFTNKTHVWYRWDGHYFESNYKFGDDIAVTCLTETPPTCEEGAFALKKRLYVPVSAIETYRNATEWRDFEEIIGFDPTGIHPISVQKNADADCWHTLQGARLKGKPLQKGIYLYGGKIITVR